MNVKKGIHSHEESKIVNLLYNKDQSVIALLYERYAAVLYGIISNVIPDEEVAKETLQDVFVKIWNNSDKYDIKKGRIFTWMVQIARNSAIDTLRSGQFKRGDKTESLPDYVSNDERLSEQQQQEDSGLRKVLQVLDEENRKIIDLIYFQDYTQKEVGEELGMPLGTVKSKVRKAILQLREILQRDDPKSVIGVITTISFLIQ